jgi:hypothetical protein
VMALICQAPTGMVYLHVAATAVSDLRQIAPQIDLAKAMEAMP